MKDSLEKYSKDDLPLSDLHLHLDGSLSPALFTELVRKEGIRSAFGADFSGDFDAATLLSVPEDCTSLEDYLTRFDLPLLVMQSEENLALTVEDLLRRLAEQNVLYSEIRFAPQLHTQKGMSQEMAVRAALEGLKGGMERYQVHSGLILCCMRGEDTEQANLKTIRLTEKYLGHGVIAADLAGAESIFPTENYRDTFELARSLSVPFTIHAGEAAGPESIRCALQMGAARIGHGVRAMEDPELIAELRERQIPLEVCPTSNVQTRVVSSYEDHPVLQLLRMGLNVTVNTDNMTVSGITLAEEYEKMRTLLGMTPEEELQLRQNSLSSLFR